MQINIIVIKEYDFYFFLVWLKNDVIFHSYYREEEVKFKFPANQIVKQVYYPQNLERTYWKVPSNFHPIIHLVCVWFALYCCFEYFVGPNIFIIERLIRLWLTCKIRFRIRTGPKGSLMNYSWSVTFIVQIFNYISRSKFWLSSHAFMNFVMEIIVLPVPKNDFHTN